MTNGNSFDAFLDRLTARWPLWLVVALGLVILAAVVGALGAFFFTLINYSLRVVRVGPDIQPTTWLEFLIHYTSGYGFIQTIAKGKLTNGELLYVAAYGTVAAVVMALGRLISPKATAVVELLMGYVLMWVALTLQLTTNVDLNIALLFGGLFVLADAFTILLDGWPAQRLKEALMTPRPR